MKTVEVEFQGGRLLIPLFGADDGLVLFWRCMRFLKALFPKLGDERGKGLISSLSEMGMTAIYDAMDAGSVEPTLLLKLAKDLLARTSFVRAGENYDLSNPQRFNEAFEGDPIGIILAAVHAAKANFFESFERLDAGADPLVLKPGASR